MKPSARTGVVLSAVSVAVSFLMVCVPSVGAAQTPTTAGDLTGSSSWAYGVLHTKPLSSQSGSYSYVGSLTVGFAVILSETVVGSVNYSVAVQRTMGLLLSVEYCRPSCAHPNATATVHFRAWEAINATLNLTSSANVTSGTSSVKAIGLSSSFLQVTVGLRLTTAVVIGDVLNRTRNLSVNLTANASTGFSPALGLVPLNISSVKAWTATSSFSESGLAKWSIRDVLTGVPKAGTTDLTGTIPLAETGQVTLDGTNPQTTVRLGGTNYDVLNLSVAKGPFALREGFLLIPVGSDLFGPSAPSWLSSNASDTGSANSSQANIDVTGSLMAPGHLGFVGSGIWWNAATPNPATEVTEEPGTGLSPAVALPGAGSNATYLQGAPESIVQATTDQSCLSGAIACPGAGTTPGHLGALLVLGGVVTAAVIATVVITARRRVPPTVYPNAKLYPPGMATGSAPVANRPPERPQPPAEDDPLGNLW